MDGRRNSGLDGSTDSGQTGDQLHVAEASGTGGCIDLESRFPGYRIGYEDESFRAHRDPWHKVIECRSGHISPNGTTKLWACTSSRRSKAAQAMLKGEVPCRIVQDGDDGINAEFNVKDWKTFFGLMGAKR